jgi:hypothetical protein
MRPSNPSVAVDVRSIKEINSHILGQQALEFATQARSVLPLRSFSTGTQRPSFVIAATKLLLVR